MKSEEFIMGLLTMTSLPSDKKTKKYVKTNDARGSQRGMPQLRSLTFEPFVVLYVVSTVFEIPDPLCSINHQQLAYQILRHVLYALGPLDLSWDGNTHYRTLTFRASLSSSYLQEFSRKYQAGFLRRREGSQPTSRISGCLKIFEF